MDEMSCFRIDPTDQGSEKVSVHQIKEITQLSANKIEIHTDHKIFLYPTSPHIVQKLYIDYGFRWIDDKHLMNMNLMTSLPADPIHNDYELAFEQYYPTWMTTSVIEDVLAEDVRLAESEQRLVSLFENNPSAICVLDAQGRFIEVNPATERVTGYTIHDFKHKTMEEFIKKKDIPMWNKAFLRALQGERQSFEMNFIHHTGNTLTFLVTDVPFVHNQKIEGIFAICKDITDEKSATELLVKSEKLSIVGQLAAGVAHEIRNPLTSLKGFAQLLKNRAPQYADFFNIMLTELDRINFIVSELLVVSKPQALQFQYKNIHDILLSTIELLNSQAIMNRVEILYHQHEELPLVRCDENQMKQVFINILNNAIDAMPKGGHVHIYTQCNKQNQVEIKFIDEGIGISSDRIPRLGEPFYSTKEKGTGLGLMVSYQIMKNHQGFIQIHSEINVGTRVQLILPVQSMTD
jgi:two-component system, sporulation sensor kinase E